MLLYYYTWKNKFKMSAPTRNEEFELADGSYSVSDIQDYFECIFKKNMSKLLIILNKNTRK